MSTQPAMGFLARILETVATWLQRASDRRQMAQLSEWQRRDIGLSQEKLENEVSKPFWRA